MTGREGGVGRAGGEAAGIGLDATELSRWFRLRGRDLPWRRPGTTAWQILLCEVMSQQTPVARVEPIWRRWLDRWPGPAELAAATPAEVLRMWGKLGYPRRALRLQECARTIVDRHDGRVPEDLSALLALPGIGDYTARAVLCFAYGHAVPVVDTNVRRVVARAVEARGDSGPPRPRRDLDAVQQLLPADRAEAVEFSIAVMELGALVCTARRPRCEECPIETSCAWVAAGSPPAAEKPRGQSWQGTDRQVRGAMMAVLRAAQDPVPRPLLLTDLAGSEQLAAGHRAPADVVVERLGALWRLDAPAEQRERALAGLLGDGLAAEEPAGIRLPG